MWDYTNKWSPWDEIKACSLVKLDYFTPKNHHCSYGNRFYDTSHFARHYNIQMLDFTTQTRKILLFKKNTATVLCKSIFLSFCSVLTRTLDEIIKMVCIDQIYATLHSLDIYCFLLVVNCRKLFSTKSFKRVILFHITP